MESTLDVEETTAVTLLDIIVGVFELYSVEFLLDNRVLTMGVILCDGRLWVWDTDCGIVCGIIPILPNWYSIFIELTAGDLALLLSIRVDDISFCTEKVCWVNELFDMDMCWFEEIFRFFGVTVCWYEDLLSFFDSDTCWLLKLTIFDVKVFAVEVLFFGVKVCWYEELLSLFDIDTIVLIELLVFDEKVCWYEVLI